MDHPAMLDLYKSLIRLKNTVIAGLDLLNPFSSLERFQERLCGLMGDELSSSLQPLSSKSSNVSQSLLPPVQTFTARIHHAISTRSNHPHSLLGSIAMYVYPMRL